MCIYMSWIYFVYFCINLAKSPYSRQWLLPMFLLGDSDFSVAWFGMIRLRFYNETAHSQKRDHGSWYCSSWLFMCCEISVTFSYLGSMVAYTDVEWKISSPWFNLQTCIIRMQNLHPNSLLPWKSSKNAVMAGLMTVGEQTLTGKPLSANQTLHLHPIKNQDKCFEEISKRVPLKFLPCLSSSGTTQRKAVLAQQLWKTSSWN